MIPILIIFFLFSCLPILTAQECFDNLKPFQYSTDNPSCSNPLKKLDSGWPDYPQILLTDGSNIMTFDAQFKIINRCTGAPVISTLFALQVDSAASPFLVWEYNEGAGSGVDYLLTMNVNGSPYLQTFNAPGSMSQVSITGGELFEILYSINFDTNDNRGYLTIKDGSIKTVNPNAASFSSLVFTDQTTFTFCGDPNSLTNHFYCEILNLQTWYTSYTNLEAPFYPGDLYPYFRANYDNIVGSLLSDSVGGFGDATLGDGSGNFAPSWSGVALEFTTGTEYITFPSFTVFEAFRPGSNSFTISFWIKIGEGSNSGVLFVRRSSSSSDLTTVKLEADGKITAQIGDPNNGNDVSIQSSSSLDPNTWTLLTVTFQTDTTQISTYFSIYFGNAEKAKSIAPANPISFAADDFAQMGGNLALANPLYISKISIYSPGSNTLGDSSSCSNPSSSCEIAIGAFDSANCLFDQSMCDSTCDTCSSPFPDGCLTCFFDRYLSDSGYCISKCFIYSDGNCLSSCSSPYTIRIEENIAYCDFGCDSVHYLYPDGSCLSTCTKPGKKSNPRTNQHLCKGPCSNPDYFYYPESKACQVSCANLYQEDSSSEFYKQCILVQISTATGNVIKTTEKTGTAAKTVTQVTSAISSGSPLGISAAVAGKIFSNIKYLNITYSIELQTALLTWRSTFISLEFLPDMPITLENQITIHAVPYMFEKYGVLSSFLINFWENIIFLLILLFLYMISRLIEVIASKYSTPKTLRAMVQNFILTQLHSFYGDILFFSVIEYRTSGMSQGFTGMSFVISCILLIIMFICFTSHFYLLHKYQQVKRENDASSLEKFIKSKNGQEVLFRDFKDKSLVYQSFLLLLTARDLAFSLILTTLFEHPLLQTVIVLILNIAMFVYLLQWPPLTSKFDGAQQLFYEFITLSVNVSVVILAVLDAIDSTATQLRANIGRFVIAINMCFNFGALFFMLMSLGILVKEIYQEYRAKLRAKMQPKLPDSGPVSPQIEAQQLEVKDFSLDDSQHQLVTPNMPQRVKSLKNESGPSPRRISKNFRLFEVDETPPKFSPPPQLFQSRKQPKKELGPLTINNIQSQMVLVKSSSIDGNHEMKPIKEFSRDFQDINKKGKFIESIGSSTTGTWVEERKKVGKVGDGATQESQRKKRIIRKDK